MWLKNALASVKNHQFDRLSLFKTIAASTDGCIFLPFFFSFASLLFLIAFMSPFSYFFSLKSLLSTNVGQEFQVTEIPHFVVEY